MLDAACSRDPTRLVKYHNFAAQVSERSLFSQQAISKLDLRRFVDHAPTQNPSDVADPSRTFLAVAAACLCIASSIPVF